MSTTYLKLNYEQVVRLYPKSVARIAEWFASKKDIIEGLEAVEKGERSPEEQLKDREKLISTVKSIVPPIIQHDPRKLYEFFDEMGIIISVAEHPDSSHTTPLFNYYNSRTRESKSASSRQEAEGIAFMDAFKILESSFT